MNNKKFTFWNRLTAVIVFAISAITYLLTIEHRIILGLRRIHRIVIQA